jgi:hypothetical protein
MKEVLRQEDQVQHAAGLLQVVVNQLLQEARVLPVEEEALPAVHLQEVQPPEVVPLPAEVRLQGGAVNEFIVYGL